MIAFKIQVNLSRLQFCFLQAKEVGIKSTKRLFKFLSNTRTQAVYIPRNEFHLPKIVYFCANVMIFQQFCRIFFIF